VPKFLIDVSDTTGFGIEQQAIIDELAGFKTGTFNEDGLDSGM
jgi:hypothetical protein